MRYANKPRRRGMSLMEVLGAVAILAVLSLCAQKVVGRAHVQKVRELVNKKNAETLLQLAQSADGVPGGGLTGYQRGTEGQLSLSPEARLAIQQANQRPDVRIVQETVDEALMEAAGRAGLRTVSDFSVNPATGERIEVARDLAIGQPILLCYRLRICCHWIKIGPWHFRIYRPCWTCRWWFWCGRHWFIFHRPQLIPIPGPDPPPLVADKLPMFAGDLVENQLPFFSVEHEIGEFDEQGRFQYHSQAVAMNVADPNGNELAPEFEPGSAPIPRLPARR